MKSVTLTVANGGIVAPVLVYRQSLKGRKFTVKMVWDETEKWWISPKPVRYVVAIHWGVVGEKLTIGTGGALGLPWRLS